jgi:succinoglycan biosynthesis transport protein ExoP
MTGPVSTVPPARSGSTSPGPASSGLDELVENHVLRHYLAVVYRRRWTAIAVFVVVLGLAAVRTFTAVPVYEATARLLIEADSPSVVSFQDVIETNRRANEYFQTQYRLLTSRTLVKRALLGSNLINDRAFAAASVDTAGTAGATPASLVMPDAGDGAVVADSPEESAAIRRFLAGLTVTPVRNSRLVDVTFASADPSVAWRGANAIVTAFIQQAADSRTTATKDAASFLTQMLADQRDAVAHSELALQQYREQGNAVSAEDRQNIVNERLARLNEALTRARTDRIQMQTAFERVRDLGGDLSQLDGVPAVRDNPIVQRLQIEIGELQRRRSDLGQALTERHPEMIKVTAALSQAESRLNAQVRELVDALRADYDGAVRLEQAMTEALDRQRVEALAQNRRGIDLGVLQRDAETNRKLYDALLQRTKEAGITEQLKANTARIVDTAEVPRRPVRPNRRADLVVGFGAALLFAFGLVFTLELFDTRIKSPDDITRHLHLPTLAMVPVCAPAADGKAEQPLLIDESVPQNFIEAFRSLRTSILFASADRGAKSLLVSSTAPSEGKTFVSCNLAISLAMARQRVLLIDADMRRPKVHSRFGLDLEPGLSDVLVGNVQLSEAVRTTPRTTLDVLAAGTLPPNPPELLGSPQFAELMDQAMRDYDWVVLDSPPIRAVTDAAVIAHRATAVIFVTGAEMTDVKSAQVALERLTSAHARVAGVVLNRVQLKRHGYYYSQYYNRDDEHYYSSRVEKT